MPKHQNTMTPSLDVIIETEYASTNMTKVKYVPVIGGIIYSYGGGTLDFDWQGKVNFTLHDLDGKEILHDSFHLKGEDSMENTSGIYGLGMSYLTGGGIEANFYPDDEARLQLGDEFLKAAGFEIAKRLRIEPAKSYFESRTKARDGMDAKTFAEFNAKKKQLKEERAHSKRLILKNMQTTINDKKSIHSLQSGSVMVFGVGVNHYEHYPNLNYAVSDCIHVVQHFKTKYNISDSWAISLTDKEATAIKVLRFIKRNVAKFLTEDDTFIFYFSGHGAPEPDDSSFEKDGLEKIPASF